MKIAVLTDTHFGVRNDSLAFQKYMEKFYNNVFFPYLKKNGIFYIFHLGDVFDRRKYVNYYSLYSCRDYFFDVIYENNLQMHMLVGNHDTFYRNTSEINSLDLLLDGYTDYDKINDCEHIIIHKNPYVFNEDDVPILLAPWINDENKEITLMRINETNAQICMGHLELQGFEMYKGQVAQNGMDRKLFNKFEIVASGHFHHRSKQDNIQYLGATGEYTWSDYDDPRGFNIFDTETRTFEFIQNPYKMFYKVQYHDKNETGLLEQDFSHLNGAYVKVIVREKNNPALFDLFIKKMEEAGPEDLQVVEDHLYLMLEDDTMILEQVGDTLKLLIDYINQLEIKSDKKKQLINLFTKLHGDAHLIE